MSQLIRDVMTPDVNTLTPQHTVAQAAAAMRDGDIGSLPVADNDRLIGVVTDRDIVTRAVATGQSPDSTNVKDVMSEGVLYCFDDEECEMVAENMGDNRVRRLPVINRDKRLVGIVSLGDLAVKGPDKAAGDALGDISKK